MPDKSKRWVAVLRTLHQSRKLNKVSEGAELLYRRLLEVVDDNGNYDADPALILGQALARRMAQGLTVQTVGDRLTELAKEQLVTIYRTGELLHISNHFTKLRADGHGSIVLYDAPTQQELAFNWTPNGDQVVTKGVPQTRLDQTRPDIDKTILAPAKPDADVDLPPTPEAKPDPPPRTPTPQQERLKTMADAYSAAYLDVTGKELTGKSIKSLYSAVGEWDKAQPLKAAGLLEWMATIPKLTQAHKLDKTFHPFPTSIYKLTNGWSTYCTDLWLDGAKANAAKRVDADPKVADLKRRAQRCLNSSDGAGCNGSGKGEACAYCPKTAKGSKR